MPVRSACSRRSRSRVTEPASRSSTSAGATAPYSHAALGLHPRSLELLDGLGLADAVLARALRVPTIAIYEGGERRTEMQLGSLATKFPFVAVLPSGALEEVLLDALHDAKVEVEWHHRLRHVASGARGADVTIDNLTRETGGYAIPRTEVVVQKSRDVEPSFVLAADGYGSLARRQLDIDFDAVGPTERYAVFEVDVANTCLTEICLVLGDRTHDAVWPLPDGGCRLLFELEASDPVRALDPDDDVATSALLDRLVAARIPWLASDIASVRSADVVEGEHRLARVLGKGRIWLAGEAGHVTDWTAALSINLGLLEAAELARIYAAAIRDEMPDEALAAYDHARRNEWLDRMSAEGHAPSIDAGAPPWAASHAEMLLRSVPASGPHLTALLEPLGIHA